MRDIFNDPEFDKFLYGGIHDLDEPMGSLVYNLYKAGIQTTWSCSGHTGRFLADGSGDLMQQQEISFTNQDCYYIRILQKQRF
jgi:hypothetical protein